jgi:hypothetical protein
LPKSRSAAALHPLPHGTQPARLDTEGTDSAGNQLPLKSQKESSCETDGSCLGEACTCN